MPKIGRYTVHAIETGSLGLDGGAMFGVIPKPLWERRIPADERNRISLHMRCLLLEDGDRLILVDNGLGHKYTDKFRDLYRVDHANATLAKGLAALDYVADDITDVILTHLHFDHAGGSTEYVGDKLEVAFRNATFYVQGQQWASALNPNPRERPSFIPENLEPLQASGQLQLVDGSVELFPGIEVETAFGHTEALQVVKVIGAESTLAYVSDLLPTSHHLAPAWTMAYDVRPLTTMSEKADFLQRALDEAWVLCFEHDPVVEICSLKASDRGPVCSEPRKLSDL